MRNGLLCSCLLAGLGFVACGKTPQIQSSVIPAAAAVTTRPEQSDASASVSPPDTPPSNAADLAPEVRDTSTLVDMARSPDVKTDDEPRLTLPYVWIVIQDTQRTDCTTNAPGADIDAVAKLDSAGVPVGWGKIGSAYFIPSPFGDACENPDCPRGDCKYTAISRSFIEAAVLARSEGPADATIGSTSDDTGYISLNGGSLQIQLGDARGAGEAQAIRSGDRIAVYEIDKTYVASGAAPATCSCLPERYVVMVQTVSGMAISLKPIRYDAENPTCPLTDATTEGCGTTVFVVP